MGYRTAFCAGGVGGVQGAWVFSAAGAGLGLCSAVQIVGPRSRWGTICALGLFGRRPGCLEEALATIGSLALTAPRQGVGGDPLASPDSEALGLGSRP